VITSARGLAGFRMVSQLVAWGARASTGGAASGYLAHKIRCARLFDPCHLDSNDAKNVIKNAGLMGHPVDFSSATPGDTN
jgi:hypothetical protein